MAKSFFQVLELAKASSHELSFLWNCSIHAKCCIALWDGKNYNPTVKPKSQSDIGGGYRTMGKQPSSDKHQSSPTSEMMRPRSKIKIMSNVWLNSTPHVK